jgi:hypothetical protein
MSPYVESAWTFPLSAVLLYSFVLLLALPVLARSTMFPGPAALVLTIADLILRSVTLAWVVDLSMVLTRAPRLAPLVAWTVAGAAHLGISVSDVWLIAPQARELVETGWSAFAWHGLLAAVAVTVRAFVTPVAREHVTL